MEKSSDKLLEMKQIRKVFSGTVALESMDFDLKAGEIHAICGENGAGKSTLMKILSGVLGKDDGTIYIKGEIADITDISSAEKYNIRMIYQELSNLPKLTVAENIYLGKLPVKKFGLVDWASMIKSTEACFQKYDIQIPVLERVSRLTVAEKQLLEIVKAINTENSDIIIMDEPTSSLTKGEIKTLFSIIDELKKNGKSIIYISHRLDEVFTLADRISVFRDGHNVGVIEKPDFDEEEVIKLMLGHSVEKTDSQLIERNEVVYEVRDLKIPKRVNDFDMKLFKGEILGIAGLMGSGKDELVKALFGLWPVESLNIKYNNEELTVKHPMDAIKKGIVYLPEERKLQSLFLDLDIRENITALWMFFKNTKNIFNKKTEKKLAQNMISHMSVKTPNDTEKIINLSGGNQQKVVLGRLLMLQPDVMVLNDPTRGIDIGSKEEIYTQIRELASSGTSIILVSSELEEIEYLSNRVIVLSKGEKLAEYKDEEVTMKNILTCVTRVVK